MKVRVAGFGLMLFVAGCAERPITAVSVHVDAEVLSALQARGFSTTDVHDDGSYVTVENDIMIRKDELLTHFRMEQAGGKPGLHYQWAWNTRLAASKRVNIRVDLSQISSSPSWQAAARRAIANWNNVPGVDLVLTEGGPADIYVYFGQCNSSLAIACAQYPISGGNPGTYIRIVDQYSGMLVEQKEWILTHEVGHTIGLAHTDQNAAGTHFIQGTPTSDPNSVMNSVYDGFSLFSGFSSGDVSAARLLFPHSVKNFRLIGYPVTLAWDPVPGASYYRVYHHYHQWLVDQEGYGGWHEFMYTVTTTATSFNAGLQYTGDGSCNDSFRVAGVFDDGTQSLLSDFIGVETCISP